MFHSHVSAVLATELFLSGLTSHEDLEQQEAAASLTLVFSVHSAAAVQSSWFCRGGQVTVCALIYLKYFCY